MALDLDGLRADVVRLPSEQLPSVDFSKPVEDVEEIFDSTRVADLSLGKAA